MTITVYDIDSRRSRIVVKARSSLHDTQTVWNRLSGQIAADLSALASSRATASVRVDMTSFDAGGFLADRKLEKDFALSRHPVATFELTGLADIVQAETAAPAGGRRFAASATGILTWRGKQVSLTVKGKGTVDGGALAATGTFELDIRDLGLSAPRLFVFKMDDRVTVTVELHAGAAAGG